MKLLGSLVLVWLVAMLAGCGVDAGVNEGYGCGDCPDGQCYMGFCIAKDEAGSGSSGSGGGGAGTDASTSTGMPDAAVDGGGSGASGASGASSGSGGSSGSSGSGGSGGSGGGGATECEPEGDTDFCYDGPDGTSTFGRCRAGMHECIGGAWGLCLGQVLPTAEICNDFDDDCDDMIDEEAASGTCDTGLHGVCGIGIETCAAGTTQCTQQYAPTVDECNGEDEDCDNEVDEDASVACYPAAMPGCTQDSTSGEYDCVGVCRAGMRACDGGMLQGCQGFITPSTEVCSNGASGSSADEDCDGRTDEGCSCSGGDTQMCYGGPEGTAGVGRCKAGMQACNVDGDPPMFGPCMGEVLPRPETCMNQGTDDNCNGMPDDVPGRGLPCVDEDNKGICRNGFFDCAGGSLACVTQAARSEMCNGLDDNCNGEVDESYDLQNDENNCGVCGRMCGDNETCCAGNCVDVKTDETYCGSCDNECGTGLTCRDGDCLTIECDASECPDDCPTLEMPCCRNDGQCGCEGLIISICN